MEWALKDVSSTTAIVEKEVAAAVEEGASATAIDEALKDIALVVFHFALESYACLNKMKMKVSFATER